jgi:hypothetical protein
VYDGIDTRYLVFRSQRAAAQDRAKGWRGYQAAVAEVRLLELAKPTAAYAAEGESR